MYPREHEARSEHFIVSIQHDYGFHDPVDLLWLRPTLSEPMTDQHKVCLAKMFADRISRCRNRFEIDFPEELCVDLNQEVAPFLVRDWTRCPARLRYDGTMQFLGFVTEAMLDACPMLGPMIQQHLAEIRYTWPPKKNASSSYADERGIELQWLHPSNQGHRSMNFWDRVKKR